MRRWRGADALSRQQAKRAVVQPLGRGRGTRRLRCAPSPIGLHLIRHHPTLPSVGANFHQRCAPTRPHQRVRQRGHQRAQQGDPQRQPHHQGAAQRGQQRAGHGVHGQFAGWSVWVVVRRAQGLAAGIPCLEWSMPAMPSGAVVATGSLSSSLLSTPLASLKVSVNGTVLSLSSGSFRSISMTW